MKKLAEFGEIIEVNKKDIFNQFFKVIYLILKFFVIFIDDGLVK